MIMRRLAIAFALLVSSFAVTQAHADYAVVRFKSGYCRVWTNTAVVQDYQFLAFRRHWHGHHWWQYRFNTLSGAQAALQQAFATHRCHL
jgi:hypothetical protein